MERTSGVEGGQVFSWRHELQTFGEVKEVWSLNLSLDIHDMYVEAVTVCETGVRSSGFM